MGAEQASGPGWVGKAASTGFFHSGESSAGVPAKGWEQGESRPLSGE